MDTPETAPASEFTRNFGRYRMRAQRAGIGPAARFRPDSAARPVGSGTRIVSNPAIRASYSNNKSTVQAGDATGGYQLEVRQAAREAACPA
jgi:hypothetical protein